MCIDKEVYRLLKKRERAGDSLHRWEQIAVLTYEQKRDDTHKQNPEYHRVNGKKKKVVSLDQMIRKGFDVCDGRYPGKGDCDTAGLEG